ncbi:MAG TPA: hypothetical protein VMA53_14115 [Stellaceae bacterium]|nr:hypothetical protein [Stellaceae bacterium]
MLTGEQRQARYPLDLTIAEGGRGNQRQYRGKVLEKRRHEASCLSCVDAASLSSVLEF